MITAAEEAALATDFGMPISTAIVDMLHNQRIILPTPRRIERAGIAGRAKSRKRALTGFLSAITPDQRVKLDALLCVDDALGISRLVWSRDVSGAPKADNVRSLIEKLRHIRALEIDSSVQGDIQPDRYGQLAREGRVTLAHLLGRYAPDRRHAILVAAIVDLEARLTDAALDIADRMIGASFTRGSSPYRAARALACAIMILRLSPIRIQSQTRTIDSRSIIWSFDLALEPTARNSRESCRVKIENAESVAFGGFYP